MDDRRKMQAVVNSELSHWVPGVSQAAIASAGERYGFPQPEPLTRDCGEPGRHCLVADWIAGLYVRRCIQCGHLIRDY